MILEVKSCTLFGKKIAMFPDAVTDRGRRHLIELARLQRGNVKAGVLFMVHWPAVDFFLPEYHTDLAFSRTLCELKERLFIRAVSVEWTPSLSLGKRIRPLEIPWALAERNLEDRGSYLAILRLKRPTKIPVGKQGMRNFQKGYYVYVGSAKKNLTARIQRHGRLRKKKFWHIDYLREQAEFLKALPVRSRASLECAMADRMKQISHFAVPGFGASDCSCKSHLFGFRQHPLKDPEFIQSLLHFRIDRLQANL
jgi:sugar fermentation stimulation protein A